MNISLIYTQNTVLTPPSQQVRSDKQAFRQSLQLADVLGRNRKSSTSASVMVDGRVPLSRRPARDTQGRMS
ncbi:hypothetical protein E2C01_078037 [Portunus trituberculatus]|uniref:Uncharacterized protein n=1 Tax=Portunus trituberculatus TaxID=210409 RepID=A0A5B7IMU3_PORTR|nr:hypothetical protein [Portunus trituberculatus]